MENEYLMRPVRLTEHQIEQLLIDCGAHRTKKQGNNVQVHCFLHHNDTYTLGVSTEGFHEWNCFSCHAKGPDVVALVERAKKITRAEAFSYIVQKFDLDLAAEKFSLHRKVDLSDDTPRFDLSANALAAYPLDVEDGIGYRAAAHYLGIDKAAADRFRLGYRLKDHRLVFPVFHQDNVLAGLIGRCLLSSCSHADRWRNFDAGVFKRERVIMGAELAVDPDKPVIIVEGPRDFFKIRSLGWDNVRATLGSDASAWQIEHIASLEADVVPLYDEDRAGEDGRRKLRKALKGTSVLSFKFPADAIDENTGKGDPAMLTKETFAELVLSFRKGFNFARMTRRPPSPR